jgi:ABC-type cobalamin/Fe3+-siderophores transport system ATPase subunit
VTILEADGVEAGYGARRVLAGCDLRIAAGEVVSIVGPNGAGKSTLLRVLAGLKRPTGGVVRLDDVDVSSLPRRVIAQRIAVVPQILETLFPFTVRDIVALGRTSRLDLLGRPTAEDLAAVRRSLATLDLAALSDRRIDELSGGERQRAVLAMALAQEADILLLDEPTVHLDPAHQRSTLDLVRRLARERGLAIVMVLHDLNLASAMATRIVVLRDGSIVFDGAPRDALTPDLVRDVFGGGLDVVMHEGRPFVVPDGASSVSARDRVRV